MLLIKHCIQRVFTIYRDRKLCVIHPTFSARLFGHVELKQSLFVDASTKRYICRLDLLN